MITSSHPAVPHVEVSGTASLAVPELLHGPWCAGKVVARAYGAIIAEFPHAEREPRVIAVSVQNAVRLPNAIIAEGIAAGNVTAATNATMAASSTRVPGDTNFIIGAHTVNTVNNANAGGGRIRVGQLTVHARRWWDPAPVFGPLSRARLDRGDLASAAGQAEHLVGLGPGIIPTGDNVLCGLLHCAARGQVAAEVAAVLRGVADGDPVEPTARRLLAAGFGSADLAWGLVAGCHAAQMLSVS